MLYSMGERAIWFWIPHLLWPWVSWGLNQALVPQLCPGTAVIGPTSAPGSTQDWCSALARPVSIQAVAMPSQAHPPSQVLTRSTSSSPYPGSPPPPPPPMHPLPNAAPSLSPALPSFPLLNAGSRGLGLNPGSLLRGCETWDPLGLTFVICEMGMMTGPPWAGFEVKWERRPRGTVPNTQSPLLSQLNCMEHPLCAWYFSMRCMCLSHCLCPTGHRGRPLWCPVYS